MSVENPTLQLIIPTTFSYYIAPICFQCIFFRSAFRVSDAVLESIQKSELLYMNNNSCCMFSGDIVSALTLVLFFLIFVCFVFARHQMYLHVNCYDSLYEYADVHMCTNVHRVWLLVMLLLHCLEERKANVFEYT